MQSGTRGAGGGLLGQAGYTGLILGLRMLTQAGTLVLLARILSPAVYGAYVSLTVLAVLLGLVPMMGAGFLMMARAGQGDAAVRDVWHFSWPQVLAGGLVLLPAMILLGGWLVAGNAVPPLAAAVIGVTELLVMPMATLLAFYVQAHDRVPLSQFLQWIPLGFRLIALPVCLLLDRGDRLLVIVLLQFGAALAGLACVYWLVRRLFAIDWHYRWIRRDELRQGAGYMAMHLVAANPSEIDKLLATRIVGAREAGLYIASARVLGAMVMPVMALLLAAQPRVFRMAATGMGESSALVRRIFGLALLWGGACAVMIVFAAPWVARLFGPAFAGMVALLPWLAMVAPVLCLRVAAGPLLVAIGRPFERLGLELAGIATLTGLMICLAPAYGGKGMAVALLFSEACMAAIGWGLLWWRLLNWRVNAEDRRPAQ